MYDSPFGINCKMERFSTTALLAKLGFSCMLRGTWRNRAARPDNIWRRSRTAVSPSSPTLPGEVSHDAPCAKATFRVHVALGTCSPRHHEVRRQPRVAGFEAYLCRTMRCTLKLTGASHWVPSPAPFLGRLGAPCSSEINISPTATFPNQRISGPE